MFRLAAGLFRGGLFGRALRSFCSSAADDAMAKGKFFYAVRKGFKPGVYASWWVEGVNRSEHLRVVEWSEHLRVGVGTVRVPHPWSLFFSFSCTDPGTSARAK